MASIARRPFHANHAPFEDRQDDPLAKVLQPPPDETPDQRARRELEQREATRVSLEIDEGIQEDRKAYERRKKAVKILLLGERFRVLEGVRLRLANVTACAGQAESGKSTTLKSKSSLCCAHRASLSEHSQTFNSRFRPRIFATNAWHGARLSSST